jgi:hypothetical protein
MMSRLTTTSASANARFVASSSPASQVGLARLSICPALSSRMTGASGSSALRALTTAGSGSYSTSISSSASFAEYSSVAITNATSCPWNRTLSPASTAWVSYEIVGIHASPSVSRSLAVTTAATLGCASALEVSIETMRAWAYGLRRIAPWTIPGSRMSSR